ncbi:hypothetical protein V8J88_05420 [Massilia sp. W12]|uniref:hypothetical protein n=1 Tax=Massilia sp. W12 TaxID=3126507 RepID=UPI0030D52BF4
MITRKFRSSSLSKGGDWQVVEIMEGVDLESEIIKRGYVISPEGRIGWSKVNNKKLCKFNNESPLNNSQPPDFIEKN